MIRTNATRAFTLALLLIPASALAFNQSDIDAAAPGSTLVVPCAGSPHVQLGDLNIAKPLTLVGEAGCSTPTGMPSIEFAAIGSECHEVNVQASDVTIEGIRFAKNTTVSCFSQGSDSYLIVMASTWSQPVTEVPYGHLLVRGCVFEGSRRAIRINSNGDTAIDGNTFSGNARDVLFVANLRSGGTLSIRGNRFNGWGRKAVLVEPGPPEDRLTGTIRIEENVADGLATSPNFLVYDHWNGSPQDSGLYPVSIVLRRNEVRSLSSNAIAIFYPVDFAKFAEILVEKNLIHGAATGVVVDYQYGGDAVAGPGQLLVRKNVFCDVDQGNPGVFIPVGTQVDAIGYLEPAPAGATLDMFGPGPPAAATADANVDGEAPGNECRLPGDCIEITGVPPIDEACCVTEVNGALVYVDPATGAANHGAYVSCVSRAVNEARRAGDLPVPTGDIVSRAAGSAVNR